VLSPSGCGISFLPTARQSSAWCDLLRPNNTRVTASITLGTDSRVSRVWTAHARMARECRRVLKPNGARWVIGTYHNIFRLGRPPGSRFLAPERAHVCVKDEPHTHFKGKRFTKAHETLIWAARVKARGRSSIMTRSKPQRCSPKCALIGDPDLPAPERYERTMEGVKAHPTQERSLKLS